MTRLAGWLVTANMTGLALAVLLGGDPFRAGRSAAHHLAVLCGIG